MLKPFHIRLTSEMHEWYKQEGKKLGLPMSNLMILVLQQYITQKESLDKIKKFEDIIEKSEIKELKELRKLL